MGLVRPKTKDGSGVRTQAQTTQDAAVRKKAEAAATLLKHADDPTRLQVIRLLAEGERSVASLCDYLNESQPRVSHHLALLRHGAIITPRRSGKQSIYALTETGQRLVTILRTLNAGFSSSEGPGPKSSALAPQLLKDVAGFVDDPEAWFHTPNPIFGGQRPIDLIGTPQEATLRDRIEAAQLGLYS